MYFYNKSEVAIKRGITDIILYILTTFITHIPTCSRLSNLDGGISTDCDGLFDESATSSCIKKNFSRKFSKHRQYVIATLGNML